MKMDSLSVSQNWSKFRLFLLRDKLPLHFYKIRISLEISWVLALEQELKLFIGELKQTVNLIFCAVIVNPCSSDPCEGMCLLVPGVGGDVLGYKCTCAYLHQLNSDGKTCSAVQSFILYAQQDEVGARPFTCPGFPGNPRFRGQRFPYFSSNQHL